MRIQTKNKEIAWSAGKRERTERKKKKKKQQQQQKNQFLAPQLTIFNRLLLHLTHSPVPSTVNEELNKQINDQYNNSKGTNFSLLPQELLSSMKTVMAATNGMEFVLQCTYSTF